MSDLLIFAIEKNIEALSNKLECTNIETVKIELKKDGEDKRSNRHWMHDGVVQCREVGEQKDLLDANLWGIFFIVLEARNDEKFLAGACEILIIICWSL